jgi:outer membrane protein, heavy metal efflux system
VSFRNNHCTNGADLREFVNASNGMLKMNRQQATLRNREKQSNRKKLKRKLWVVSVAILGTLSATIFGCKAPVVCCNPRYVSDQLFHRTSTIIETGKPCTEVIPAGVVLEDGLDEAEAVATGLANNSLFQAALAQLGMAGGDAVQASLIANPQVLMYFPSGAKEGQYTLYAPIESYFLRPTRVKVANREYRRIGDQLVQNGLNVARDIRLAFVDLSLATEQSRLANEAVKIRADIANLTRDRFKDGDISELETIASKVDSLNAKANEGVQRQNIAIARARLVSLLGIPTVDSPMEPPPLETIPLPELVEQQLLETALACRPDYHSARWAIAAASERSNLSRWIFWRADSVVDVRHGTDYTRTGTGLRFDLPIFNRNQGGILRADWELNAAMHARDAIRDQIYQDVRVAYRQLSQSQTNLEILEKEVLPNLTEAVAIAEKGFADGGTDYLLVLQTTTLYLDVRSRILDQRAIMRRAVAELERSVGRSLVAAPLDVQQMLQATAPPEDSGEGLSVYLTH